MISLLLPHMLQEYSAEPALRTSLPYAPGASRQTQQWEHGTLVWSSCFSLESLVVNL